MPGLRPGLEHMQSVRANTRPVPRARRRPAQRLPWQGSVLQRPKVGALPRLLRAEDSAQRRFRHHRGARRSVRRRFFVPPLRPVARSQLAAGTRPVKGQAWMQPGQKQRRLEHQWGCLHPLRPGLARPARSVELLQLRWDGLHGALSLPRQPAEPQRPLPDWLSRAVLPQSRLRKLIQAERPRVGSLPVEWVNRVLPCPRWRAPARLETPPEPVQEPPLAVFGRNRGNT